MQVHAHARRTDDWWAVEVPEIPGLFTQARRLDQVPEAVADAALLLGHDDVEVTVVPQTPTYDELIAAVTGLRGKQQAAEREATAASRRAVTTLRRDGLTVRDVASLLHITPQRVSQIEKAANKVALR